MGTAWLHLCSSVPSPLIPAKDTSRQYPGRTDFWRASFGLSELAPSPKHPISTLVCLMLHGPRGYMAPGVPAGMGGMCPLGGEAQHPWGKCALFYRGKISTTWFLVKQKCTVVMCTGEVFLPWMSHREWKLFKSSWFSYMPKQKRDLVVWAEHSLPWCGWLADRTIICQSFTAICYKRYVIRPLGRGRLLFQIQPFVILEGGKGALICFPLPSHFAADKFWATESLTLPVLTL